MANTTHRNYPKPVATHDVVDDEGLLEQALDLLDGDIDQLFTLMSGKAATLHTHVISDITGLQAALDAKRNVTSHDALGDLSDVNVAGAPTGYTLQKQANGKWEPVDPATLIGTHTHVIADIINLQTALDAKLSLTGGTMTGPIILAADPTNAKGAATKQYVDSAVSTFQSASISIHKWTAVAGQTIFAGAAATPPVTTGPMSDRYATVNLNGRALLDDEYSFSGVDMTVSFSDIEAGEVMEVRILQGGVAPGTVADGAIGSPKLASNAVSNDKLADMSAPAIKGRVSAGTGDPEDLTPAQVRGMILPANATGQLTNDGAGNLSYVARSTVTQAEAEAGTSTTVRDWTAERVKQAIAANAGGKYTNPPGIGSIVILYVNNGGNYPNGSAVSGLTCSPGGGVMPGTWNNVSQAQVNNGGTGFFMRSA